MRTAEIKKQADSATMVKVSFREKQWEIKPGAAARDAVKKLGIDPESVLVVVNGNLSTDDVILKEGDQVKLVAVVSGGCRQEPSRGIPR